MNITLQFTKRWRLTIHPSLRVIERVLDQGIKTILKIFYVITENRFYYVCSIYCDSVVPNALFHAVFVEYKRVLWTTSDASKFSIWWLVSTKGLIIVILFITSSLANKCGLCCSPARCSVNTFYASKGVDRYTYLWSLTEVSFCQRFVREGYSKLYWWECLLSRSGQSVSSD